MITQRTGVAIRRPSAPYPKLRKKPVKTPKNANSLYSRC